METAEPVGINQLPTTVLTVPMRNGNENLSNAITLAVLGSYRTYEEWKLLWKNGKVYLKDSSYRTYEEWKHSIKKGLSDAVKVLTVPMRNGN